MKSKFDTGRLGEVVKWTKKDVKSWINQKAKEQFESIPYVDPLTGLPIQIRIKNVVVEFEEIS